MRLPYDSVLFSGKVVRSNEHPIVAIKAQQNENACTEVMTICKRVWKEEDL
jgi:hypothetical protein